MKPLTYQEKHRWIDPADQNERATMPLLMAVHLDGHMVEADSPYALVAALVGNEYYDAKDEVTRILMRMEYAIGLAAMMAGADGIRLLVRGVGKVVYDGANPPRPAGEEVPSIDWKNYDSPDIIWTGTEKEFLYSLHRLGVITLYERKDSDIFLPHPAQQEALKDGLAAYRCKNCLYFDPEEQEGFCHHWRYKVGGDEGYKSQCFVPRIEGFKGWFDQEATGDDYLPIDGLEGEQKPWLPPWMMLTPKQQLEQGWMSRETYDKMKAKDPEID